MSQYLFILNFSNVIVLFLLTLSGFDEKIKERAHLIQPEIKITQFISEVSLLTPLLELEGEGHVEKGSSLRRRSLSDGRSGITDMELLTVTNMMQSGLEKACLTINEVRKENKRDRSRVSHTFESKSF